MATAAARQTNRVVRSPAGRPCSPRSKPINPPATAESASLSAIPCHVSVKGICASSRRQWTSLLQHQAYTVTISGTGGSTGQDSSHNGGGFFGNWVRLNHKCSFQAKLCL